VCKIGCGLSRNLHVNPMCVAVLSHRVIGAGFHATEMYLSGERSMFLFCKYMAILITESESEMGKERDV